MASLSQLKSEVFSREHRRQHHATQIMGLNAYDRHRKFMNDYVNHYYREDKLEASEAPKLVKTDFDTLRETYRFIRTEEDDEEGKWEQRLAKRYYDKLFKEYCIADLSRYKVSKIGLRWRSEKEVINGKAAMPPLLPPVVLRPRLPSDMSRLAFVLQVNFAYKESGENRQALVKLRVCPSCAHKLNYRKDKKLAKQKAREERRQRKRQRRKQEESERSLKSDISESDEENTKDDSDSENGEKYHEVEEASTEPPSSPRGQAGTSQVSGPQSAADNDDLDNFFDGMFL